MEITLKECLPEADALRLAIGVDLGTTLVSKLGTRAHRDRICLGAAVEEAAACEERSQGGWIGITKIVYDGLPEELATHFQYSSTAKCYVAKDLQVTNIERAKRAAAYAGGGVFLQHTERGAVVSDRDNSANNSIFITPARPYAHEQ